MVIAVTGATGLIGHKLCHSLEDKRHRVIRIRRPDSTEINEEDAISRQISEDADVFIHLAGAPVFGKRWSKKYMDEIYDSRIIYTRSLVKAISRMRNKPSLFICASAAGYYGSSAEMEFTEVSTPAERDFLSRVCQDWEKEAAAIEQYGVRRISMRTGIVLSPSGGALENMMLPFKFYAGGCPGTGKQWLPWIHIDDVTGIIHFILENGEISGAINFCSPGIITMKELIKNIGQKMHRPSFLVIPGFVFKMIYGRGAAAILNGQKVIPDKLLKAGYRFLYPDISVALDNLISNK